MSKQRQVQDLLDILIRYPEFFRQFSDSELEELKSRPEDFIRCAVMAWKSFINPPKKDVLRILNRNIVIHKSSSQRTGELFKDYSERSNKIDDLTGKISPSTEGGVGVCYELVSHGYKIREILFNALSIQEDMGEENLKQYLFESGKTFSLGQVDELHRRAFSGDRETCLDFNGQSNHFFVHDSSQQVFLFRSVLPVYGGPYGGQAYLRKFSFFNRVFNVGIRLYFRNQ